MKTSPSVYAYYEVNYMQGHNRKTYSIESSEIETLEEARKIKKMVKAQTPDSKPKIMRVLILRDEVV